jgi:hypothetical protein
MVKRVDLDAGSVERPLEQAPGRDLDLVAGMGRRRRAGDRGGFDQLPLGPAGVAGMCLGEQADVLSQSPAERDIEHLDPAAHAEDRNSPIERLTNQLELERITLGLSRRQQRVGLLTVAAGFDVATRCQHQGVDRVEGRTDRVQELGQRHGQPAGEQHRTVHADAAVVAEVVQAGRHSDQRLGHICTAYRVRGVRHRSRGRTQLTAPSTTTPATTNPTPSHCSRVGRSANSDTPITIGTTAYGAEAAATIAVGACPTPRLKKT